MVSAVLFITFFVLLVLNVPISVCLGLSSAAAILYSGTSLTIVATNIYSGISKFLLLAIPFFRIIRKYHGEGGDFHAPDPFR